VKCRAYFTGLEKINKVVKWRNIEAVLMEHYEIGTSKEGKEGYPPLMLLKVCSASEVGSLRLGGFKAGGLGSTLA